MPKFAYKARRRSGELVQDEIDAADRPAAVLKLQQSGLFPLMVEMARGAAVTARRERAARGGGTASLLPEALRRVLQRQRKPRLAELATYAQQLTNLLKAGMPLTLALNSMSHLGSKGIPAEVSRQLKQDVMEGKSLSEAMSRQPRVFSDLFVNMVRAGEQSGAMVDVLERLAHHFERFSEVRQKLISAMIYPAVVCCVGVVIIFFFMTVMLPKFLVIFEGMKGVTLPASTRLLIGLSDFFKGYWWLFPAVGLVAVVLYNRYKATEPGALAIDRLYMRAPVLGRVVRLTLFSQFARTLGTLLQNGVPVLTALRITEQVISNRVIRAAIAGTREAVTDGKSLAQPLARSEVFPQLMIDLVRIGEETGDVAGALRNVAETYENELTIALRVMTNLIEPAMIILMAVGVGFLLFSVLSAMFQITANLGR
ncbi:MAG: type II secretion system F family protein [Verrucomicrobia bacterium]|nr:type II secretion system F family protein [Verrucomicrobiota bacterium]